MSYMLRHCLALTQVIALATSFPTRQIAASNDSIPISQLFNRDDDIFDPTDLSFITKLAAIGDSYSAGIGSGDRLGTFLNALDPHSDWACSRYNHAYPYLINEDDRLGDKSKRRFQFQSCSGAVTKDVIHEQIPHIDSDQQVILLSAGGNDVELLNILNQCIFQWGVINSGQVAVAKAAAVDKNFDWAADFDFDALGRGCEGQLARTKALVDSNSFSSSVDAVLNAAKTKLAKDGTIYYTGYGKFFAETLTNECDKVSWSTWIYKSYNMFQPAERLTVANRRAMNDLVDAVNSKLADAVRRAGPSVKFVNYDSYVGEFASRYCEAGVDESTTESNAREELMFFELNTWDPLGGNPWKRSNDGPLNGTFKGQQEIYAQITRLMDPNAEFTQQEGNTTQTSSETAAIEPAPVANFEIPDIQVPNFLPDGYGRVFHPQALLHQMIANLIIYEMVNRNEQAQNLPEIPEDTKLDSCPYKPPSGDVLHFKGTNPGRSVKPDTELRILCVGDSITVGFLSDKNGGDGNGYRLKLRNDLFNDKVVFAGTESDGTMDDGYFAAWSGKTIQFVSEHVGPSLEQRPNIVLVHAGTNDMNPNNAISTEGNDPQGAADRLGKLIDQIIEECPDATILIAMIVNTCDPNQSPATKRYQSLVPSVAKTRRDAGHHVLAVDFTTFGTNMLQDCIHPTNEGYRLFGDYWYDFITQIPKDWIKAPVGKDPDRKGGTNENGGLDKHIPPPDWGKSPVQRTSKDFILDAFRRGYGNTHGVCKGKPVFRATGQIALGLGHNGDWKYHKFWQEAGKVADGLHLDPHYVRLHDMNGNGKADYIWLDPQTGEIRCWLNNLPKPWSPAGTNNGIIGSGAGPAKSVFIADMNGDGLEDYMVVNPKNGAVKIWWNYGPDNSWVNGWKFVEGGEIATGVPHANWETLRFPDINGDGRADYVYIGEGGALMHYMNTGTVGGQDVLFLAQGGIATGAAPDITKLVFADMNGDGRDDYLIWDDKGGLTGFLNQPTQKEGVPVYIPQGPAKTLADGISQNPSSIRLADLDGDGKDDYAFIDEDGGIHLWYNRGHGDTSLLIDNIHFADLYGEGLESFIWLDAANGAPIVYYNGGYDPIDPLGWLWSPRNGGKPVASGAAPASQVQFGDIDGDGKDDYLVLDPKTGELTAYLNDGEDRNSQPYNWHWKPTGSIASGLGPGRNVRFADIDGDGRDDYIYLDHKGGTTIYRNVFKRDSPGPHWTPLPQADASGISQRPDEISFHDINHDGKADYIWTSAVDSSVHVWLNNYPNSPAWLPQGKIASGVGISGSCVKWVTLLRGNYSDYVAVDPTNGAIAAWLNLCDDPLGNPLLPGTRCKKDSECEKYDCETGKHAGCMVNGIGGGKEGACECLPN